MTVYVVVSQQTDDPHRFVGAYATLDGAKAADSRVQWWYEPTENRRQDQPRTVLEGSLPYRDGGDDYTIYVAEVVE